MFIYNITIDMTIFAEITVTQKDMKPVVWQLITIIINWK